MDLFDAIINRYSHKEGFKPYGVLTEDLNQIAQAGLDAPSGNNRRTVQLILLPDRRYIDPVCDVHPTIGLRTAPAAIAVFTDKSLTPEGERSFEKEDYSAAVQNILLAATALGYSSLWLDSPYFKEENKEKVREILGAPEYFYLWAVIPIGKPDGVGIERVKEPIEKRASYGKYGCKENLNKKKEIKYNYVLDY